MYSNIYNTMSQTNSNKGNNEWGKPNDGWPEVGDWYPDKEITKDWGEWDPHRKIGSDEIAKANAEWNKPKKKLISSSESEHVLEEKEKEGEKKEEENKIGEKKR